MAPSSNELMSRAIASLKSGTEVLSAASYQQQYPNFAHLDARLGDSFDTKVVGALRKLSGKFSPDAHGFAELLEELNHLDPSVDLVDDVSKVSYQEGDPRAKVFEYTWGYNVGTNMDPHMSGGFIYILPVYFPIGAPAGWVLNPGVRDPQGYNSIISIPSSSTGITWWISFHVYIKLPGG